MHDPFPTPFTDEVLEGVGYYQIKITKEDRHKTTFVTEWGCFQYTMILFGLKNSPAVFSQVVISDFKDFIQKLL